MLRKLGPSMFLAILANSAVAQCNDPSNACAEPCPAELACDQDSDCPEGFFCPPFCAAPAECDCEEGSWVCDLLFCVGKCIPIPIPSGPRGYEIIDLGTLGGPTANALAVNEAGVVVGEADTSSTRHAYLWQNGTMTDIGQSLPPPWSSGIDINNELQVLIRNGDSMSLLWDDSLLTEIPGSGTYFQPNSMNDSGIVVGNGFLWDGIQVINVADELGLAPRFINNFSDLAGTITVQGETHAGLWKDGYVHDLGTLGGEYSRATGLSDRGQVIGESERAPGGDRNFYPFFWNGEVLVDLGIQRDFFAGDARGINNCGEVVGIGGYPGAIPWTTYIYNQDGRFKDLFDLIPAEASWYLLIPNDINDHGDIVGYGLYIHRFGSFAALTRAFIAKPMVGDFDSDGDVDLGDYARLQTSFSGLQASPIGRCLRADLDRDNDIDLMDLAEYRCLLAGPQ